MIRINPLIVPPAKFGNLRITQSCAAKSDVASLAEASVVRSLVIRSLSVSPGEIATRKAGDDDPKDRRQRYERVRLGAFPSLDKGAWWRPVPLRRPEGLP